MEQNNHHLGFVSASPWASRSTDTTAASTSNASKPAATATPISRSKISMHSDHHEHTHTHTHTHTCSCQTKTKTETQQLTQVSTRRNFLSQALALVVGLFVSMFATSSNIANAATESKEEKIQRLEQEAGVCKNCNGKGVVACELCSGTGFWRATGNNDKNLKYKGVVCPTCEGAGTLRCPVCLGTGEGYVRGLLRRRTIEPGPGRTLQS